jgi:membrane protein
MRDRFAAWAGATFPGRCVARFLRIEGTNRGLVIGGQAFTTLIPFLIIAAGTGSHSVGDSLILRLRLSGDSAQAMRTLFDRPPDATGVMSVAGLVVLVSALFSLTRALQRTYEAAWELPRRGLPGTLSGIGGTSLLIAQLLVLALFASALRGVPAGSYITGVVRFAVAVPMWLVLQYLLLSRRVPARALLPGAVVAAAGQLGVMVASGVWMPRLIATDAARYGLIGVTFALVSWLILLGLVVVAGAVVSAELGRPAHPPRGIPGGAALPSVRTSTGTGRSDDDGGAGGARLPEQGTGRARDGGDRGPA